MPDVASYGVEERCNRLKVIQPDSVALTRQSFLINQVEDAFGGFDCGLDLI